MPVVYTRAFSSTSVQTGHLMDTSFTLSSPSQTHWPMWLYVHQQRYDAAAQAELLGTDNQPMPLYKWGNTKCSAEIIMSSLGHVCYYWPIFGKLLARLEEPEATKDNLSGDTWETSSCDQAKCQTPKLFVKNLCKPNLHRQLHDPTQAACETPACPWTQERLQNLQGKLIKPS